MLSHNDMTDQAIRRALRKKEILYAGHIRTRIYGHFSCPAGKRMQRAMRVFFSSEHEALLLGFRPCGHCMPLAYRQWRGKEPRDKCQSGTFCV